MLFNNGAEPNEVLPCYLNPQNIKEGIEIYKKKASPVVRGVSLTPAEEDFSRYLAEAGVSFEEITENTEFEDENLTVIHNFLTDPRFERVANEFVSYFLSHFTTDKSIEEALIRLKERDNIFDKYRNLNDYNTLELALDTDFNSIMTFAYQEWVSNLTELPTSLSTEAQDLLPTILNSRMGRHFCTLCIIYLPVEDEDENQYWIDFILEKILSKKELVENYYKFD